MTYQGADGELNSGIKSYVEASSADFISKTLSVVMEEDNDITNSEITAKAALMINDTTQDVLYANNVYERIYPASTTKLLTTLVALKYSNLEDLVTVSEDNAGITVYGAKLCNFKKGDTMTMETLLNCLLVYSGNDAAITIAEHISGSEEAFVELMNEEAVLIGATGTHFTNSHGLHDPNHYTTAYDMYLFFKECLKYEEFLPMINQTSYEANITNSDGTVRSASYETTNMFLLHTKEAPEGVTVYGGKTGSTLDAGDCLILYSNSNDNDYISAVFKASDKTSLYDQHSTLLEME
jgi:D-alanyl-D-alanine carboxypeptidase (penicillin-binding protein 5/6)